MRLDRTLTLGVFGPLKSLVGDGGRARIPILMYHSIAPELDIDRHPYFRTVTSPRMFARQIEHLLAGGYTAITLSEALGLLDSASGGAALVGPRRVVITFDDGFCDFRTEAFPVLQRAGYPATVFMPSNFIGKTFITGRSCLSAADVRNLADDGIEFGSHSASHRRLVELGRDELRAELCDSRAAIEDITGRAVATFSCPFRFPEQDTRFVSTLAQLLDECGYRGGVTTAIGRAGPGDDLRFLPRLPVNDCDDRPLLLAKLAGHYDWLRSGQRLRKRARAWLGLLHARPGVRNA